MEKRGTSRNGPPRRGRTLRRPTGRERMRPGIFFDRLLREVARKINFIYRLSGRHFEAKKFCLELEALRRRSGPPRRA